MSCVKRSVIPDLGEFMDCNNFKELLETNIDADTELSFCMDQPHVFPVQDFILIDVTAAWREWAYDDGYPPISQAKMSDLDDISECDFTLYSNRSDRWGDTLTSEGKAKLDKLTVEGELLIAKYGLSGE